MKMRRRTLWRVPVYCVIASILSYYLTFVLSFLYIDTDVSVNAEGAIETMINPVRSAVLEGALFLAVLMVGGFCFFQSMTKKSASLIFGNYARGAGVDERLMSLVNRLTRLLS